MIKNRSNSIVLLAYPQNVTFHYNKSSGKYQSSRQLKDILSTVSGSIVSKLIPHELDVKLNYENTTTTVDSLQYQAAFYFSPGNITGSLTCSEASKKPTTVSLISHDLYATTLNITCSEDVLMHYVIID